MKTEIFTLCDAATADAGGKLNILGSFDRLNASAVPITHPLCALAIKLRFERLEEGQKRIGISFVDSDGKAVMPTLDAATQVVFPPGEHSVTACLVLQIQQMKLPNYGEYSIDLAIDGRHEASIPLFVKQALGAQPQQAAG
ncbi:hypothetical protein BH20VER1_BH20VER1_26830 [soil metagenome]